MSKSFKTISLVTVVLLMTMMLTGFAEANTGGDFDLGMGADVDSLDPVKATASPSATVTQHVYEPLFDYTPDGEIVPLLAEGYDVSEDGKVYEIYIKQGIEFHDGEYLDAEAVRMSLERQLDPDSPFYFLIDVVEEIEVIDDYTVRLHLEEPFAPLTAHLSHASMGIVSPGVIEDDDEELTTNPVGTGPFEFVNWDVGEQVVLERNANYWGENANFDTASFHIVPEDGTRVAMLETGELDAIMYVPPREAERLEGIGDIDVVEAESLRTIHIGFNLTNEEFEDVKVRQALNYAVDNSAIVEHVLEGVGEPSDAPISPVIFGYEGQEKYEYNPDKAVELLEEAGYEDGFGVTLHHPTGRYMLDDTVAEAVQSQLEDVNIEVELETLEWVTYMELVNQAPEESEHDMYMYGWGTMTGDADYGLYALFHSTEKAPAGNNFTYFSNDTVDELLDEARINPDPGDREDIYSEAIEVIWDEAPWLFLHSERQINAVRSDVEGLIHHPKEFIGVHEGYFNE